MDLNTYSLIINSFKNEHLFILEELKKEINFLVIQNTQNIQENQETKESSSSPLFFQENQENTQSLGHSIFSNKRESPFNLSFSSSSQFPFPCINSFSSEEKEETLIILINFYREYQEAFLNEINYLFKSLKLWELILCNETQKTKNINDEDISDENDEETICNADIEFRLNSIKLIKQDLENSNTTRLVLFNSYLNLI